MTPIARHERDFSIPSRRDRHQAGAAMNVDLNSGWDYWSVMGEQVEDCASDTTFSR
ncbi:MAG TPA: hypothetical protein VFG71_04875 [Nitrospiraceae bacterium]|nr:hypothetical protein [Nitrospiraceae bacterium]